MMMIIAVFSIKSLLDSGCSSNLLYLSRSQDLEQLKQLFPLDTFIWSITSHGTAGGRIHVLKISGVVTASFMKDILTYNDDGVVAAFPHRFQTKLDRLYFDLCNDDVTVLKNHFVSDRHAIDNWPGLDHATGRNIRRNHALVGQSVLSTCATLQVSSKMLVMKINSFRLPNCDIRALYDAYTTHIPELPREFVFEVYHDDDSDRSIGAME